MKIDKSVEDDGVIFMSIKEGSEKTAGNMQEADGTGSKDKEDVLILAI